MWFISLLALLDLNVITYRDTDSGLQITSILGWGRKGSWLYGRWGGGGRRRGSQPSYERKTDISTQLYEPAREICKLEITSFEIALNAGGLVGGLLGGVKNNPSLMLKLCRNNKSEIMVDRTQILLASHYQLFRVQTCCRPLKFSVHQGKDESRVKASALTRISY